MTEFYKISEVAKMLKISMPTIKKIIDKGDIKMTYINDAKRISSTELEKYIKERQ